MELGYPIPAGGLQYAALVLGEALVGIVIGFFLTVVFSAFQLSAQFFSLQMGFGASEVFDPLSQVEIPIMGQFLNLIAMYIFLTLSGFNKIFLVGIYQSFRAMRAVDLVMQRDFLFQMVFRSIGGLFEQALVVSFPILGTLFLIQVTMGLLAKAGPQMNLLTLGFPISIGVAYLVLIMTLPFIAEAFSKLIDGGFSDILGFLDQAWRGAAWRTSS